MHSSPEETIYPKLGMQQEMTHKQQSLRSLLTINQIKGVLIIKAVWVEKQMQLNII